MSIDKFVLVIVSYNDGRKAESYTWTNFTRKYCIPKATVNTVLGSTCVSPMGHSVRDIEGMRVRKREQRGRRDVICECTNEGFTVPGWPPRQMVCRSYIVVLGDSVSD